MKIPPLAVWVAALFAALSLGASSATSVQPPAQRVLAVGDIHGAEQAFAAILESAGLVDAQRRWTGGRTRLVQTGDFFDRGGDIRPVLDLLMRLEQEAERAGGRVDVLFGNHEGMNVVREYRDVWAQAFAAFADGRSEERRRKALDQHAAIAARRGLPVDRAAWMQSHPPGFVEYTDALRPSAKYGRWVRSLKATLKVGDTVFMHAGLAPGAPADLNDVNRTVERDVRSWDNAVSAMERAGLVTPYYSLQEVVTAAVGELQRLVAAQQSKTELEDYVTQEYVEGLQWIASIGRSSLLAPESPLWYRGFATSGPEELPRIDALLKRAGATRFVVGHTITPTSRITARLEGRVVMIDTGMIFNRGRASVLELADGRATAIYADGRQTVESAPTSNVGPRTPEPRTPEPRTSEPRTPEPRTSEPRTPNLRTPNLRTPNLRTPNLRTPNGSYTTNSK